MVIIIAIGMFYSSRKIAKENKVDTILSILKTGNRAKILEAIEQYGRDEVADIASHHVEELTTAVVAMLENVLKTQLIID